jgi:hypothetical protein
MTPPTNEPRIAAIAQRVREFLLRQPGVSLPALAERLCICEDDLRNALGPDRGLVDAAVLIDVITDTIRHYAVDPRWVLTGEYDPATHRAAQAGERVDRREVQRPLAEQIPGLTPTGPGLKLASWNYGCRGIPTLSR